MESGFWLTERYRLVDRLDGGGAKEVWLARDELLGRPVAVKVLTAPGGDLQARFQKAVNRAAGLSHPGLEKIYDSDRTRDASGHLVSYVVTEFLDAASLAGGLAAGSLTPAEIADVCAQIARALAAAHAADVAHGDLTPDKVLPASEGIKIVDTGIGAVARTARATTGGTAPVPLRPALDDAKAADVRALGGIIAACLAGGPPLPDLAMLAARCLDPDPALRPSAMQVASMLSSPAEPPDPVRSATVRRPSPAPRDGTGTLRPPESRTRRGKVRLLAAAAIAIAIPVTAVVAALAPSAREPLPVAQPQATRSTPADTPAPAPASSPGSGPTASPVPAGVSDALGRLRPIVDRGSASGEIRPDVALDLDNVITNLENDLLARRPVDVSERIAQLREKIRTRLREQGLSRELADQLTGVLSAVIV
ncbi:protein kinase domain-containing protein [Actinomadura physcomitrii]|uniref:protein kinase domain-containing protein n=1 Tax=Actinomadura physcomitrii TaxID=2650748 RepID=UPI001370486B|nr:protein kinase [Actinomadura physcomitrii]